MIKQRHLLNQQEFVTVEPLEVWFEELSTITDNDWSLFEYSGEMLRDKMTNDEKLEMIQNSWNCGVVWAKKMKSEYNIDELLPATSLASYLKLIVTDRIGKPTKYRMVFAQFIMDDKIEIIDEPIERYELLSKKSDILPSAQILKEILIAHEIFHFLEENNKLEMYTRNKTIKLWKLFNYEHRSTVNSNSEIAAMAFAKELCGINFSPQVINVLLSYPMEVDFSKKIYDNLMHGMKNLRPHA